ncbi:S1 family peptidase [Terrarubrum flagellatum]|uniref:S1 family peptidase n=1 Tax=Terrirubrum flagellatum TaxID=2895980 RepID=UPI0031456944
MKRILLAAAMSAALAAPALAVVGAPAATDPSGSRRHTVAIVLQRGLCTGVLVERDLVLTAAHCLTRNRVRSVVALDGAMKPRFLSVAAATVHPSFRYADRPIDAEGADLALIRLAQPAPADMSPAPIARFGDAGDLTLSGFGIGGARGSAGSGRAGTLREAPMRARALNWRDNRMIAAIGGTADEAIVGLGGCRGDSGGPLYGPDATSVVGIVSWSSGAPGAKSSCGGLTMATEVSEHTRWINAAGAELRASNETMATAPRVANAARRATPSIGAAFPDLTRDSSR